MTRDDSTELNRRRFLAGTGLVGTTLLSGCLGIDLTRPKEPWERPERQFDEPLPEGQENCVSIDGIERDPDDVVAKEDVAYQFYPEGAQMCANCRFFCKSIAPESMGACTEVEGAIRSSDWCALFQHTERLPENPPTEFGFGSGSDVQKLPRDV